MAIEWTTKRRAKARSRQHGGKLANYQSCWKVWWRMGCPRNTTSCPSLRPSKDSQPWLTAWRHENNRSQEHKSDVLHWTIQGVLKQYNEAGDWEPNPALGRVRTTIQDETTKIIEMKFIVVVLVAIFFSWVSYDALHLVRLCRPFKAYFFIFLPHR